MNRKVALDWDDQQIRMVVGEPSGMSIRITDAIIEPIGPAGLQATLTELVANHGLTKCEALIAVGREHAELRQMEFPPVPASELPDMVRFQAVRTFAAAGENAIVDYLPTGGSAAAGGSGQTAGSGDGGGASDGDAGRISAIVSASGPAKLDPVRKLIEAAGLSVHRIALRPIAAAALFQVAGLGHPTLAASIAETIRSTMALLDLVGDEAEIVLFRGRDVSFVRTVRLPSDPKSRVAALAGEIRRSLIACGAGGSPCNVVMWGSPERHADELAEIVERLAAGQNTEPKSLLLNPFDLVDADASVREKVQPTVGRLSPLIGLLRCDARDCHFLIDFENPRRPPEPKSNRGRLAAMIGVPVAAVLLIAWTVYGQFSSLDGQIAAAESANAALREDVKVADRSIERTERVDQFLDADVQWLDELQRLAETIPPAEQLVLSQISAVGDTRNGGGRITILGAVTSPDVINNMESSMRDDSHRVVGDGARELESEDAYRWQINETIYVDPTAVRQKRYAAIQRVADAPPPDAPQPDATSAETADETPADDSPGDAKDTEGESTTAPTPNQPEVQS